MSKKPKTIATGRKPRGYWQDWENVERELTELITKIGHFPTPKEAIDNQRMGLLHAMHDYHGGASKARDKLGYEPIKRPQGYWENKDNVLVAVRDLEKRLGHFPTQDEMVQFGYGGLPEGVRKCYVSVAALKKELGLEEYTKPSGYWKSWENIEWGLKKLIEKLGHFPTQDEVGGMANGIKIYGGINTVRKRMGYEPLRRTTQYLKDFKSISEELAPLIRKFGRFPSQRELYKSGNSHLIHAIQRFHGGFNKVRDRLGYKPLRRADGHWQDWKNVERELNAIIKKIGHFPTEDELDSLSIHYLAAAIQRFHGGFPAIREKMGHETPRAPMGYWQKLDNVLNDAQKAMKEIGASELPSQRVLTKNGYQPLVHAITNYHGGFPLFRQKLNEYLGRESDSNQLTSLLERYAGGENE